MTHLRLPQLAASVALLAIGTGLHAQVAISSTGTAPNPKAMLEVIATNKGFLAPRVTAAQRGSMTGMVAGLIVYQTDGAVGYYYYDTAWRLVSASRSWSLGGNNDITAADFLGTVNNYDLNFRTQGLQRVRLASSGELLIHNGTAPAVSERMHVQGAMKIASTTGTNPGALRFDNGQFQGYVDNGPGETGWYRSDNVFGTRKGQVYTLALTLPCNQPSSPSDPVGAPRRWPIIGPASGFGTSGGMDISPYGSVWEDGRRQHIYKSDSLAAKGFCGPIKAVAFYVSSAGGNSGTYHFIHISLKNTPAENASAGIDPTGLTLAHSSGDCPSPMYIAHSPGSCGNLINSAGWKIHNFNVLGSDPIVPADATGFNWMSGSNLLVETAMDNQNWGIVNSSSIQYFNAGFSNATAYVFCDACGHSTPGGASCGWSTLPTVPQTGVQAPTPLYGGWGWVGGWDLNNGTSLRECSGDATPWVGSRGTTANLPRIAFYANYTGGNLPTGRADYLFSQNGVMIGDATWASQADGAAPHRKFKGPGTISAQKSVWSSGVLLSDHVFDHYYEGTIRPEDAAQAEGYAHPSIPEMAAYMEQHRHLPTIDGRAEWNTSGPFSLDKLTNQLWVSVEQQALYIKELNERMDALQQFLVEKRLNELKNAPKPVKK